MAKIIIFLLLFFAVWNIFRRLGSSQSQTLNRSDSQREKNRLKNQDVSDGEFKEVK